MHAWQQMKIRDGILVGGDHSLCHGHSRCHAVVSDEVRSVRRWWSTSMHVTSIGKNPIKTSSVRDKQEGCSYSLLKGQVFLLHRACGGPCYT